MVHCAHVLDYDVETGATLMGTVAMDSFGDDAQENLLIVVEIGEIGRTYMACQ